MSRLQTARDRLEQAVAKLEAAAGDSGSEGPDRAELAAALDAAQEENSALHATNETVGSRLDTIIDRLRSVLDS